MKKTILSILVLLMALPALSQSTLHRNYNYSINTGYEEIYQVVAGKAIFYSYNDMSVPSSFAPCIQKNDLDGNPIWKKVYSGIDEVHRLEFHNGNLIMIGEKVTTTASVSISNVCIASIDTSNGNLIYFSAYTIPGASMLDVRSSKILSNGDLLVGGSTFTAGPMGSKGYLARFNTTNGNAIYQYALFVQGQQCSIRSIEEYNSGLLYACGSYGNSSNFATRLSAGVNPVMVGMRSFNAMCDNISKLNTNRLLIHSGGLFLKLDTNLVAASSTTAWTTNSFGGTSFYRNGKIYTLGGTKQIAIIDTAGAMNNASSSYTYNVGGNSIFGNPYFGMNATNLFITYNYNSTAMPFSLLKTDLTANMSCAGTKTVSFSTFSLSSSAITNSLLINTGTLSAITPTIVNGVISHTVNCLIATGVVSNVYSLNGAVISYQEDGYLINSTETVSSVDVFDLSGKVVKHLDTDNVQVRLSLSEMQAGIYIVSLTSINGNTYRQKIIR